MENQRDIAIQIESLKKQYRLGVIGGGTLKGDIQSWWARKRGKEDPNSKIGAKQHAKNETFMALDGINLTVYKGERLGIIGHNGAGKSTLLKLLSRVTAPTEGKICIDGRISSMLEVGTGFNPELTGRENIYLNGAILGMSKAEVDSKIEEIIEFSECRQFIDTPVKRYSSGMYVKLAFSVAAHLDSEILVMDEVLAVGDMKFQQKCLGKMSDVSQREGRTVLYVSHNMNTIRALCSRCVVLDHGRVELDGGVEDSIRLYMNNNDNYKPTTFDLSAAERYKYATSEEPILINVRFMGKHDNEFEDDENMQIELHLKTSKNLFNTGIRFVFRNTYKEPICSAVAQGLGTINEGNDYYKRINIDIKQLSEGTYRVGLALYEQNDYGRIIEHDVIIDGFWFKKIQSKTLLWSPTQWGAVRLPDAVVM